MSSRRVRLCLCLLLVPMVALAGCSGSSGNADSMKGGGDAGQATASGGSGGNAKGGDGAASNEPVPDLSNRQLVRTGTVRIRVDSFDAASRDLRGAAASMDGYVSDSTRHVNGAENRTWTTGRIVFRVPKAKFDAFISRAKKAGEVEEVTTNTEDVTDQIVDVEARLENLRAQRDRLRALYEDANDTATVLQVEERLSNVQGEIERLQAQRKSLRGQVAYSTITVEIAERPPNGPTTTHHEWYDTGLLAAFADSVHGVAVALRALAVAVAYAAPYLLVFGVPIALLVALFRRRRAGRTPENVE